MRSNKPIDTWVKWLLVISVPILGTLCFRTQGARREAEEHARSCVALYTASEIDASLQCIENVLARIVTPQYLHIKVLAICHRVMPTFEGIAVTAALEADVKAKLQSALTTLETALDLNPDDDMFHHNRAWIRYRLGYSHQAILADLRKAVALDGASVSYRVSLGTFAELIGNVEEVRQQYTAAFVNSPESLDAPFFKELHIRNPRLWETALDSAVLHLSGRDREGRDYVIQSKLARLLLERGDLTAAEDKLERVVRALPHLSRPWAPLARIQMGRGLGAVASVNVHKAMFRDAFDPLTWSLLGHIAQSEGDNPTAARAYERSAQLAGQRRSPHALRARWLYKTNAIVRDDVLPPGLLAQSSVSVIVPTER